MLKRLGCSLGSCWGSRSCLVSSADSNVALTLVFVGVLGVGGDARRWNTRLQVRTRKEEKRVEGQAGRIGRRKLVVGGKKLSGAGRRLQYESGR